MLWFCWRMQCLTIQKCIAFQSHSEVDDNNMKQAMDANHNSPTNHHYPWILSAVLDLLQWSIDRQYVPQSNVTLIATSVVLFRQKLIDQHAYVRPNNCDFGSEPTDLSQISGIALDQAYVWWLMVCHAAQSIHMQIVIVHACATSYQNRRNLHHH